MLLVHTKVLANIYSTLTAEQLPQMHISQFSQNNKLLIDKTLFDASMGQLALSNSKLPFLHFGARTK